MNGIDPANPLNRPAPTPEAGAGKVAGADAATDDSAPPQKGAPQPQAQATPDQASARRGHSDPAVSLSATLAKIELGTTLNATVVGFDSSSQPIIKTDQGTFILDVSGVKPPLNLKLDAQLELRVAAIDHVIEAELVAKNAVQVNPPLRLALTLVTLDAGSNPQTGHPNLPAPETAALGLADHYGPALGQTLPQGAGAGGAGQGLSAQTVLPSITPLMLALNIETAKAPAAMALTPEAAMPHMPLPSLGGIQLATLQSESSTPLVAVNTRMVAHTGVEALKGLVLSAALEASPVAKEITPAAAQILVKIVDVIRPDGRVSAAVTPALSGPMISDVSDALVAARASGRQLAATDSLQRVEAVVIEAETSALPLARDALSVAAMARDVASGPVAKMLLLSTSAGLIRALSPVDVPVGTRLVVELAPHAPQAPLPPATQAGTQDATLASPLVSPLAGYLDHWPVLDDIVQALALVNPALAGRVQANLSAPLQNMGSAAMFLASAMGLTKGAERWLGRDVVDALVRTGKQSLIARLDDDLQHISKLGKESAPADWKPAMLPFHDGRETQAMPVMIRHFMSDRSDDQAGGNRDDKAAQQKVTRFVIDVSMSRMGAVQMDGMIKARSFSLIMRTEQPLAATMRDEIRTIFGAALTRNRFEGDLDFQPGKPFPLSAAAPFMGHGGTPENVYV